MKFNQSLPYVDGKDKTGSNQIIIISLATAVCLIGDSMLYIVLPIYWREIGLESLIEVGILLSINRFIRIPINPVIGAFYKRYNLKSGLIIAVIIASITTISYGIVEGFWIWLIIRACWGVGWSFFKLGTMLFIIERGSENGNRGHFLGLYNSLYRIGSIIGMFFGALFVQIHGLTITSIFFGLIAFFAIPFIIYFVPVVKVSQLSPDFKTINNIFRIKNHFTSKQALLIFVSGFLIMLSLEGTFTATLSSIIESKYGFEVTLYSLIIGAATIGGFIQSLKWFLLPFLFPMLGKVLDREKEKSKLFLFFLSLTIVFLIFFSFDLNIYLWLVIVFTLLLLSSILLLIVDTMATEFADLSSHKVDIISFYTISLDLGAAVGPIIGFMVGGIVGIENIGWMSVVIVSIVITMWFSNKTDMEEKNQRLA
nr:MFS transporter [Aquibacillus halophilus]